MRHEAAGAEGHIDRAAEFAQIAGGVGAGDKIDMHRLVRNPARDPLVDHVHRAADRLAAEQQHGRSAQYLDALGGQRVDRDGVIVGCVGGIDCADAVDQHLDAFAREAPQDRARGARREARCRNAGQAGEHFAQLAIHIALQFVCLDDAGARQEVEFAQALRADDDLALIVDPAVVQVFGRGRVLSLLLFGIDLLGQRRTGGQHGRERESGDDKAKRVL